MFTPIETSEIRTVWIDSPSESMIGFANSTRVTTTRIAGDEYNCELGAGLWPDDHDLVLMCLNIKPKSDGARSLLLGLAEPHRSGEPLATENARTPATVDSLAVGKARLLARCRVFPAIVGMTQRTVTVDPMLRQRDASTLVPSAHAGAIDPDRMAFDEWRLQLDVRLKVGGLPSTEHLPTELWGDQGIETLRSWHQDEATVDDVYGEIAALMQEHERARTEPEGS